MALIKCKECGKEFSNKAKVCPNCAAPKEPNLLEFLSENPNVAFIAIVIILLFSIYQSDTVAKLVLTSSPAKAITKFCDKSPSGLICMKYINMNIERIGYIPKHPS